MSLSLSLSTNNTEDSSNDNNFAVLPRLSFVLSLSLFFSLVAAQFLFLTTKATTCTRAVTTTHSTLLAFIVVLCEEMTVFVEVRRCRRRSVCWLADGSGLRVLHFVSSKVIFRVR